MEEKMMRAAVLEKPERLRVKEIPVYPFTSQDEVLLEVEACGVCGSDLRYYKGENPWALHTLGEERPNPPNIVMGHEYAGTVKEVNDRANQHLVGKRVGVLCFKVCGRCHFCLSGRENLCKNTIHMGHGQGWGFRDYYPGAYAEYCLGWASQVYPLPDHVSSEEAAMLDILAVGLHVASRGLVRPGGTVLCLGCGPAGNAIMQASKTLGAARTIITDISPTALSIAEECGADVILDAEKEDVAEAVMKETGGKGVCSVYDSIGTKASLESGLRLIEGGGTFVNMAVHAAEISFPGLVIGGERSIRTSSNFRIFEFQAALDYLAAGRFKVKPWLTHRFPLSDIQKAFDLLLSGEKQAFKAVILPGT
jgi:threonine dehydrogenase-like Zn-dependent dehydrogenase